MTINRNTKKIKIGNIKIGSTENIAIQSMLNIASNDIEGNITQAISLKNSGCDIIRVAIPNMDAIQLIYKIKSEIDTPIVADIHFDYKLAIESIEAGIDKIRINPGNIGSEENIKKVVRACQKHNIPIRIGVNSGSLEKDILKKYFKCTPEAMVESALLNIKILEKYDFDNIVISLKSSNVVDTVAAYRIISKKINYPLHLGITESGISKYGIVKSSIGIGSLLLDGIGDTIRVSLTSDPIEEIMVAKKILKYTGNNNTGIDIISCPTCGRAKIDVIKISNLLDQAMCNINKNITIAIMGCVVNGPGEAKDADIGIAGGNGCGVLFKKGEIIKKCDETDIVDTIIEEINNML